MEERAERLALYIIENQTTVRAAAQKFGISKSTVHMDDTKWNDPRSTSQCHLVKKVRFHRIVKPDFFVIIFVKALDMGGNLCGLFANRD